MTRQAKIQISADVQSLKQAVAEAKKTMQGLGQVKISNKSLDGLKDAFGKDLEKKILGTSKHISNLENKLNEMGKKATLSKEFGKTIDKVRQLKVELENLKKVKKDLESGDIGVESAAKKSGGLMKAVTGGVGKVASIVGLGIGIGELYNTGKTMATQRAGLRALTGGSIVGADSTMGYTPEERRQRATGIAGALGRNVSERGLTGLTNLGERLERGYGIGSDSLSATMREGRKSGIQDQQKFLAQAIGVATTNGLEGSRIGEYLSSMTGFMGELADGITVDNDSVNALSLAFGDIPFFKNDPSRLFSAFRGMDEAFKNGDRFQQAQAARAIQTGMGGNATPASIELRRQLGLFGGGDRLKDFAKQTGISSLGLGGGTILQNMFNEMKKSVSGQSPEEQLLQIMSRAGLQGEGGMRIAQMIREGKGSQITEKQIQLAQMSPEQQFQQKLNERLNSTFVKTDSDILQLNSSIQALKEYLAGDLMRILSGILDGLNKIVSLIPGSEGMDKVATAGKAIEYGVGGYLASKVLGKVSGEGLSKVGGALGKGAGYASKLAPEVGFLSKVAPYATKALPLLGKASTVASALWPEEIGDEDALLAQAKLSAKEKGMMSAGSGVLAPSTNNVSFPNSMQTTDPIANQILGSILQTLQGRSPSVLQDKRGPSGTFYGGKVGK